MMMTGYQQQHPLRQVVDSIIVHFSSPKDVKRFCVAVCMPVSYLKDTVILSRWLLRTRGTDGALRTAALRNDARLMKQICDDFEIREQSRTVSCVLQTSQASQALQASAKACISKRFSVICHDVMSDLSVSLKGHDVALKLLLTVAYPFTKGTKAKVPSQISQACFEKCSRAGSADLMRVWADHCAMSRIPSASFVHAVRWRRQGNAHVYRELMKCVRSV